MQTLTEKLSALSLRAGDILSLEDHARAEKVIDDCRSIGAKIIYPGHPDYPEDFFKLEHPPSFLSVIGEPVWLKRPCLSIVGSRDPSEEALRWMELHLPRFFASRKDIAVVSGGARGIDQKAHALAIRAGIPTVAFFPSGLKQIYPSEMANWKDEILNGGGALVSQYSPDQEIRPQAFEGRNRLIAALSKLLFVVEARRRSGSLMTARLARELSRTISLLPAFPGEYKTAGGVDLLFDGGFPLRDADDLTVLFEATRTKSF